MTYQPFHVSGQRPLDASEDPVVWLLASYRAGENAQLRALAEAFGKPFEVKRLTYRRGLFGLFNLARRVGTVAIRRDHGLAPPWPRIVISAGLRNEPVARWIREQSRGETRIVFVGRTWAPAQHFDLIVTTPQYRLPDLPNILHNPVTLQNLDHGRLRDAGRAFAARHAHLPRPWTGVLVGGDSGPFALRHGGGRRLGEAVSAHIRQHGGSALVTTSSRTHALAARGIEAALVGPHIYYRWRPDDAENPYLGLLASADELVVTSDSIAMLSEALATGKPVYLYDVGKNGDATLGSGFYRLLQRFAPQRLTRDVDCVHRMLEARGVLAPFRSGRTPSSGAALCRGATDAAVERLADLAATPSNPHHRIPATLEARP